MPERDSTARLVKSRQRVADHGEVFTPGWLVDDMLDQVKSETERIDARFLEPACGSGNFLVPVLARKLAAVKARHGRSDFEKRHYALFALMCVYGIELLPDNVAECRANLLEVFTSFLRAGSDDVWARAASVVLAVNVVQGDALKMTDGSGEHIIFPEWGYLGGGKYQRRDFRFDNLTQRASFQGTLFDALEEHEVFTPVRSYPRMTVQELASSPVEPVETRAGTQ
ncbi:N-6 DNA methylase [Gryllotalpicola kribbensis]|uniref:site-specific DNA-methyltransferase (adenine-specific) n=1 Tax=Gryllotalpicola kribbensis TaxID=993084 RepID=A0ABP8AER2_9MICO